MFDFPLQTGDCRNSDVVV